MDDLNLQNQEPLATISVRNYLSLYKQLIVGVDGCGSLSAKIHWVLHYVHYAKKYGSQMNFDGGIGERHLKPKVKIPARRTQKRQSVLALQSSERDYERTVINTVHTILELKGAIESSSKDHVDEEIDTTDTMLSNDRSYNTKGLYDITFDMNYNIQINSNQFKSFKTN